MARRALRIILFVGLLVATALAGYQIWTYEQQRAAQDRRVDTVHALASRVERDVQEMRAGQRAYVATGQGFAFWKTRVDAASADLKVAMTAMNAGASDRLTDVLGTADEARVDLERLERKIADHAAAGRQQHAADLIFADALQAGLTLDRAVDHVVDAVEAESFGERASLRRRELAVIGMLAAAGLLAALLLLPTGAPVAAEETPESVARPATNPSSALAELRRAKGETLAEAPRRMGKDASAARVPGQAGGLGASTVPAMTPLAQLPAPPQSPLPADVLVDLPEAARICSELARVQSIDELPSLVAALARTLDALGVIIWIKDADQDGLRPLLTHGYPAHTLSQLGIIPSTADNATAKAFRLAQPQVVASQGTSPGAITVPLVTTTGCVGVMAAELRHGREQIPSTVALARIFAAQFATLTSAPASTDADTQPTPATNITGA